MYTLIGYARLFRTSSMELRVNLLDRASEARSQALTGVGWWRQEDGGDAITSGEFQGLRQG
jgi:hypothetical protein